MPIIGTPQSPFMLCKIHRQFAVHDLWYRSYFFPSDISCRQEKEIRKKENKTVWNPFLLFVPGKHNIRPQKNSSFQRNPVLIEPGTSVSAFTRSCVRKSRLSLWETHPVLPGAGRLRSCSDLLTCEDPLCCPACGCHSTSGSLPAEVRFV